LKNFRPPWHHRFLCVLPLCGISLYFDIVVLILKQKGKFLAAGKFALLLKEKPYCRFIFKA
jgi:hypothetical protein